jgi:hypothetical protein
LDGTGTANQAKAPQIHVYNPETLEEAVGDKIELQKGSAANHMAPAPGSTKGQVVVTVAGDLSSAAKTYLAGKNGKEEMQLGIGWKASVNHLLTSAPGYAEYSPDGKMLFLSAFRTGGLDVFEVTDIENFGGLKKTASIRTARGNEVGGHFFVSPDGKYLVDHHGVVIETAKVGGSNGEAPGVASTPGAGPAPPGPQPPAPGVAPAPGRPPGGRPPKPPGGGPMPPGGALPPPPVGGAPNPGM